VSTQPKVDFTSHFVSAERLLSRVGVSPAYITLAIGYLLAILQASHLTLVNFLAFTALQVLYSVVLWSMIKAEQSSRQLVLRMGILSVLTVLSSLLALTGISWDWLLYLVTVAICFMVLPLRASIAVSILLYVILGVNLGLLDHWNWSSISPSLISFLPAFGFVAVFSLVGRVLSVQKERAERLLHQVEESNAELERAHEQLRNYANEVEELTIVRERTRLAREIHDSLGHYLTILNIQLETISKLQERDPGRAAIEVAEARRVAAQSMQEVRNAVAALRPTSIATLSLTEALAQLGSEFEHNAGETELTLDFDTQLPPLSPDLQVALYRAAQEALTNVRKHAHATKVLVRLRYEDELLELVVLDNGCGASNNSSNAQADGFGLRRIRVIGPGDHRHADALP